VGGSDFIVLAPLLATALASLVVLLLTAYRRRHLLAVALTVLGFAAACSTLFWASGFAPRRVTSLLLIDAYALFLVGLFAGAGLLITLLGFGYLQKTDIQREEFYVFLLLAVLGAEVLAAAIHFASFFLGLELLSVSLYGLIAYLRDSRRSLEAGIKYLILSATASAFLLFGMALIYFEQGTMEFSQLFVARHRAYTPVYLLAGMALVLTGIGFKLAVVPFHLWTPDVYQGAPAPVTALIATVSKGAVIAVLMRLFLEMDGRYSSLWVLLSLIAVGSMFLGNFLALRQENVKRLLAYSSIAHLGYLLVAVLAGGSLAAEAVAFYLLAYFVTTLGAFGVVTVLSTPDEEAQDLDQYRGLFWRRPWPAGIFTLTLLSLAGIPVTVGFLSKFYVVAAGLQSALWLLVLLFIVNSVIGLFYYLRVIHAMMAPLDASPAAWLPPVPFTGTLTLATLTILLLWWGLSPSPMMNVIGNSPPVPLANPGDADRRPPGSLRSPLAEMSPR
jgi:NADH-quinone oxidoreductase subunit N